MPCGVLVATPLWVLDVPGCMVSLRRLAGVHPLIAEIMGCLQQATVPAIPPHEVGLGF